MKPAATDPASPLRGFDPSTFRAMLDAALGLIEQRAESINDLNVFPVPDGDTGTNMLLTMRAAVRAMSEPGLSDVRSLANALAHGALMGARGNSGVILSQFLRGLANGLCESDPIDGALFARALVCASGTARAAVANPVEGTMLTVAGDMAEAAVDQARVSADLTSVLKRAVDDGRTSVARTRDLMPRLREAGVVDAGGLGLLTIVEGMYHDFVGEPLPTNDPMSFGAPVAFAIEEPTYGYCTEFLVQGDDVSVDRIRTQMGELGDSLLVVGEPGNKLARVHLHTHQPGRAIDIALGYGDVDKVKIENMQGQVGRRRDQGAVKIDERISCGLVVVSVGAGFTDVFTSLGATVVPGGPTLNPSTEEIVHGLQRGAAPQYVVLPNSSNVYLAAKNAGLVWERPVLVVPSRNLAEGVAAAVAFQSELTAEENAVTMGRAMAATRTGQVSEAHRTAALDDREFEVGDVLGLVDDHIRVVGRDRLDVVFQVLDLLSARKSEVITIYPGESASLAEAESIRGRVAENFARQQVDLVYGGQPHYCYILACE